MKLAKHWKMALAGLTAGIANGLLGAGGGMLLVPLLVLLTDLEEGDIFPASVCIILPLCTVSLLINAEVSVFSQPRLWLLLGGSCLGGIAAGLWGRRIPTVWLHRFLGVLVLWGGIRYLC